MLVVRSQELKQNLYWIEITNENAAIYLEARSILEQLGYVFEAVVIDGKKASGKCFPISRSKSASFTRWPS